MQWDTAHWRPVTVQTSERLEERSAASAWMASLGFDARGSTKQTEYNSKVTNRSMETNVGDYAALK